VDAGKHYFTSSIAAFKSTYLTVLIKRSYARLRQVRMRIQAALASVFYLAIIEFQVLEMNFNISSVQP